ncbi:MAG: glycosyltransferase, partial [Candidatus Sulfotelmatobacter sp.]
KFLNPLRILVVSHTFPPQAEVGSIRVAQLCRYLSEYEIEPVVLTVDERFYRTVDPSRTVPPSIKVMRTRVMSTPLEWYGSVKGFLTPSGPPANSKTNGPDAPEKQGDKQEIGWLRQNILALFQIPDRDWGWYLPAILRAEQFLREERVDAMFSSGPPWTTHLVARHLKKKFQLPWLIDFRDPWSSLVPDRTGPRWWNQLAEHMEESCIRKSDMVLCNTDRLRRAFQRRYSTLNPEKFQTLTNGFEDLPAPQVLQANPRRLLLHLGSIYANRRIDTFLTALAGLVRSGRLNPESFQVVFQGGIGPAHRAEAASIVPDLLQNKCVEFRSRVDWKQAWQLLWQSDLLLLFQGNHELQVPAKFYEYLQTGIPILAVTEEGALTDVLQATESGIWAPSGDPQAIADGLLRALEMPKRSREDVGDRLANRYHYRALAGQLSQRIRELSTGH